jgi:hypothetical protein
MKFHSKKFLPRGSKLGGTLSRSCTLRHFIGFNDDEWKQHDRCYQNKIKIEIVTFQYDSQWLFLCMNMSFIILWCFVLFLLPMWIIIIEIGLWDVCLIKAMWYQWKINKLETINKFVRNKINHRFIILQYNNLLWSDNNDHLNFSM